jgi:signal transduction histidine kinase
MIQKRPSVRLRVTLLVLVPLVFLAGLAAFDVTRSASSALTLIRSKTMLTDLGPPVASLQQALAAERTQAIVYFAHPAPDALAALGQREAATDHAVALTADATNSAAVRQDASPGGKQAIAGLRKDLAGLAALRAGFAVHSVGGQQAFAAYSGMIAASYQVLEQAIIQDNVATQVLPNIAIIELAISNEYLQQESALLNGDFADRMFPASAYQGFVSLVGAHRLLYAQSYSYLDQVDRAGLNRDVSPQVSDAVTAFENKLVASGPQHGPPPVRAAAWNREVATLSAQTQGAVEQALARLVAGAKSQASATLRGLYLTGGIALAVVIASLVLSMWMAVSLARQLRGLRDMALELANVRLPALVRHLGAGEDVDVASQMPEVKASTDEIGQVEAAFMTAQRTAVEATIDQAKMRRGIGDVFRNLARRSQSLLARQMMLIDTLERRAAGPEDLESLFRIDHLTTRMRRHAESLIVLAGDLPERTFLDPVPFVDVLRAAAAEVEDYTRIRVTARSSAALAGPAVADVIHMLAELMENAATFSPPTADVRVTGSLASRGYAVDVEDRGLGMTELELGEANAKLAEPPMFDLSGSDRLGLHVAAQLAHRHGIRITLRGSPYGGTTAIVLIPNELVVKLDGPVGDGVAAVGAGPQPEEVSGNGRAPALVRDQLVREPAARYLTQAEGFGRVSGRGPENGSGTGQVSTDLLVPAGRHAITTAALTEASPADTSPADTSPAHASSPMAAATAAIVAPDEANSEGSSGSSGSSGLSATRTENGLPVRVRQQRLAPPLREDPPLAVPADPATDSRSPDAARQVMSAFWQGRTRGLSEADHEQANGADRPEDGETR